MIICYLWPQVYDVCGLTCFLFLWFLSWSFFLYAVLPVMGKQVLHASEYAPLKKNHLFALARTDN